jgi:tetratricopeptide (TPR) repeat protein
MKEQSTETRAESRPVWVRAEPFTIQVRLLRGVALSLLAHAIWFRDPEEAERVAREGLEVLGPMIDEDLGSENMSVASFEVARLHNVLKNPRAAAILARKSLAGMPPGPDRIEMLNVLAEALRLEGRSADAEQAIQEALRCKEAGSYLFPYLYMGLGLIRRAAQNPSAAADAFEQALRYLTRDPLLRSDPESLRVIYGSLAEIWHDGGEYGRAVGALQALGGHPRLASHGHLKTGQ